MKKSNIIFNIIFFLLFSIHCSKTFSIAEKRFLKQFIHHGDLVFDVGANIGKKTKLYLNCGAQVVCIEPQQKCIKTLNTKFSHNKNVIIIPKGVASQSGYIDFFPCNTTTISTCSIEWTHNGRFANQGFRWNTPIKIEVITLDEIIKQYGIPQFCKIDVEGFEHDVLKGLSTPIPYLSFEFTYEFKDNAKECLNYLVNLGYKNFNFVVGETAYFAFDEWISADILLNRIYSENKCGVNLWGDIYAKYEK